MAKEVYAFIHDLFRFTWSNIMRLSCFNWQVSCRCFRSFFQVFSIVSANLFWKFVQPICFAKRRHIGLHVWHHQVTSLRISIKQEIKEADVEADDAQSLSFHNAECTFYIESEKVVRECRNKVLHSFLEKFKFVCHTTPKENTIIHECNSHLQMQVIFTQCRHLIESDQGASRKNCKTVYQISLSVSFVQYTLVFIDAFLDDRPITMSI